MRGFCVHHVGMCYRGAQEEGSGQESQTQTAGHQRYDRSVRSETRFAESV
jgi:hypothetical protein